MKKKNVDLHKIIPIYDPNDRNSLFANLLLDVDVLKDVPKRDLEDINFVKMILTVLPSIEHEHLFNVLGENLKKNKDFIIEAIEKNSRSVNFISEELKNNKSFMLRVVKEKPTAYEYIKDDFKRDREFIELVVNKYPIVLRSAPEDVKSSQWCFDKYVNSKTLDIANYKIFSKDLYSKKENILKIIKGLKHQYHYKIKETINELPPGWCSDIDVAKEFVNTLPEFFNHVEKKYLENMEVAKIIIRKQPKLYTELVNIIGHHKEIINISIEEGEVQVILKLSDSLFKDTEYMSEIFSNIIRKDNPFGNVRYSDGENIFLNLFNKNEIFKQVYNETLKKYDISKSDNDMKKALFKDISILKEISAQVEERVLVKRIVNDEVLVIKNKVKKF